MAIRFRDLPLSVQRRLPKNLLADSAKTATGKIKRDAADEASRRIFRVQCQAIGLPPYIEDYQFCTKQQRLFEADFGWPDFSILLEINGGIWRRSRVGAHSGGTAIIRDMNKGRFAALNGFFLVAFTTDEVKNGTAIEWVTDLLEKHGWRPR